jgi:hypothetical protein
MSCTYTLKIVLSSYCSIFYYSTFSCLSTHTLVFIHGKEKSPTKFLIPIQQGKLSTMPCNYWFTCSYPTCFKINITILPTFYAYMAWLLQYNLAFDNGVNIFHGIIINLTPKLKEENITPWILISAHCMNHYTNLKVQIVLKMFPQILNDCYNIVCMHITTITLDPMSKVTSCI